MPLWPAQNILQLMAQPLLAGIIMRDMSDLELWQTYLPPFKAVADAGVATFMNSFNILNGIPATGNGYLQRTILKGKWNYKGFVVSD